MIRVRKPGKYSNRIYRNPADDDAADADLTAGFR